MASGDYTFASDNVTGLHPEALKLISAANSGHVSAYGEDAASQALQTALCEYFDRPVKGFPVFNGTAANALSLASLVRPFEAVVCHTFAHADLDECNAPEFFTGGAKLIPIGGENGKICPKLLSAKISERDDVHFPKIRAITLTLSSEVGTVYSLDELKTISRICKDNAIHVHIDGARFFNALASLQCTPAELINAAGASVLSLGLVKIGASLGEVVVFFDEALAEGFDYRRKQAAQLASKMRFISASIPALLGDPINTWAQNANQKAAQLSAGFQKRGISPVFPTEANAVFVRLASDLASALRDRGWVFYDFVEDTHRFVCHWATTDHDIQRLLSDIDSAIV